MSGKITVATTACFSGHRLEKLPDNGAPDSPVTKAIKSMLYLEIQNAINDGYNCFITGLSAGIDLWAGDMIVSEKKAGKDIALVAASPFPGFGSRFEGTDRISYANIVNNADAFTNISEGYSGSSTFMKRNDYLVENSSRLIAAVSDYRSGTGSTIRRAQKLGIDVRIIDVNAIASMGGKK